MMVSSSAEYMSIELALLASRKTFRDLGNEIDRFEPLPRSSFVQAELAELERLHTLNPHKTRKQLEADLKPMFDFRAEKNIQFADQFSEKMLASAISIIVLSHALCEAVINAVLAVGLYNVGKEELFAVIEKADVKQKWTVCPSIFVENYQFPKSNYLYAKLSDLCKSRNSLAHSKITITDADRNVRIKGSQNFRPRLDKAGRDKLGEVIDIPYLLHEYICSQLGAEGLKFPFSSMLRRPQDF